MDNTRILTIQDISCTGQCSLTVALPIISACGIETAIIPSAVLSNHTAFSQFTFRDLTGEIPKIRKSWKAQDIKFSALYTGYLGNAKQIACVKDVMRDCIEEGGLKIVDPAKNTAEITRQILAEKDMLNDGTDKPTNVFYVSDINEKFEKICLKTLKRTYTPAKIDIEKY